jgi:hypothetical protein
MASPDAGASCETLQAHVVLELERGALDMGQRPGIEEFGERMGQFLQQEQALDAQQSPLWLFSASNDAPGTKERRSDSDKASALFVVFMP